jgi:hypothetical protein
MSRLICVAKLGEILMQSSAFTREFHDAEKHPQTIRYRFGNVIKESHAFSAGHREETMSAP